MTETILNTTTNSTKQSKDRLEEYSKNERIFMNAIADFVDTKQSMSQSEKWEAFDAILNDTRFENFIQSREQLIKLINRKIRSNEN